MMLLLLLSCPGNGRLCRASPLLLAAVLLCVVPVSGSLPAGRKCLHIDCAKERRHFCRAGSSHCGPCLSPLEENEEGRCVAKKRHRQHDKVTFDPILDEEIDYLHSIIEKQQLVSKPEKQHQVTAAVTSQTDVKKSKTDASNHKQKNQSHLSDETLHATTTAPRLAASALPNTPHPKATGDQRRVGPIAIAKTRTDTIIVIMISVCVAVGTVAVILATVCYVKLQKDQRLAQKVDYPAFGGASMPGAATNGNGPSMGDKTLAQSAQMYHYQHQKQQMLSVGSHKPEQKVPEHEITSDEEEVGGDFTVYECPGLAPTGEMEVKNPLFDDSHSHLQYQGNHK
ncbi:Neural proliferation differentiation and control protein 1 [Larimichthys crocea]|uniref:Neural proliferation differentiation and control protein 1 n=1 Tax=Larimichthys crocea TaxID=215358 RepID=A0A6G0I118_LARCR|nr:Neural proliferation differentiation and control protein 1 [Larimichthys crocea]